MISPKKGFTLVELMVAVAVIAILLMGLFASLTTSLYTSQNSKIHARQQKLAQKIMEEFLVNPPKTTTVNPRWEYQSPDTGLKAFISMEDQSGYANIKKIIISVVVLGSDRPPFVLATLVKIQ